MLKYLFQIDLFVALVANLAVATIAAQGQKPDDAMDYENRNQIYPKPPGPTGSSPRGTSSSVWKRPEKCAWVVQRDDSEPMHTMPVGFKYDTTPHLAHLPYKFTGKERDQESGLDYFGARYYVSLV